MQLPPMTVEGEKPKSLTAPSAEEAQDALAESTPGAVSVIKAEDYKTGAVLGGQDALRRAPGVYAQSRDGYGDIRFSIRGSGTSAPFGNRGLRILRDGLPLTRSPSGFFLGPNLQVASSWFADQANSLRADSFAILGLSAGYERAGYRLFLDVRNLPDEAYAASTEFMEDAMGMDAPVFNPGLDRTVFAGIEFDTGLLP